MKIPEEIAKQVVNAYVIGYSVNNTPRLTDAVARVIQEERQRAEKLCEALEIYAGSEYVDVKQRCYQQDEWGNVSEDLEIDDDGSIARQALQEYRGE